MSPWASGRVGIDGDNEAGLSYLGRSFRIDGRHAFDVGPLQLSLGAGASVVVPRPDDELGKAYGGGADVPILLGDNSKFVKATGWQPTIKFEQTLSDMLEYWRSR